MNVSYRPVNEIPKAASPNRPVSFVYNPRPAAPKSPGPTTRGERIAAKKKQQSSEAAANKDVFTIPFTTVTNQLPERGLVSAQSLAAVTYDDAIPLKAGGSMDVQRTRGIGSELGGKMEISVNILNGSSFSVLMAPTETGKDLKRKIETNSSIPADQQQLVFAGKQIKDDKTMYDYGITKNCVIFCVPKNGESGPVSPRKEERETRKPRRKKICPCQALPC